MSFEIRWASRKEARLRMALIGVSGSGKTFTAVRIAKYLGYPFLMIDTEEKSADNYQEMRFQKIDLQEFNPLSYVEAISFAEQKGYQLIIVDSLSHAWVGKGGVLDSVDQAQIRSKNKFAAWREVSPQHNTLVEKILRSPAHIIVTMRAKQDYAVEQDEGGRSKVKKLGMAAIQRDGVEYEYDLVGDMDIDHNLSFSKTRCTLLDKKTFRNPGKDVADIVARWLSGEFLWDEEESPGLDVSPGVLPQGAHQIPPRQAAVPPGPPPPQEDTEPPSQSPDTPITVQGLIDRLPSGFTKLGVPPLQLADAIEAATIAIAGKWGVGSINEIPDSEAAKVRNYMNGELLERLAEFVPIAV